MTTGVGISPTLHPIGRVGLSMKVTGTVKYDIEHTFGDGIWHIHDSVKNLNANSYGHFDFPISGIRISQTLGAGTVELTINESEF